MVDTTSGKLTLGNVRSQLRAAGVKIARTEYGEYRVAFVGMTARREEATACYTDDLADALASGLAMARQHDQKGE